MKIDAAAIRELAELLDETGLTEIEVSEGDNIIRVSRGSVVTASTRGHGFHMESEPTIPQPANLSAPSTVTADHPGAVSSPMVGTVYMQAEPGSPAFIRKGDIVKPGDTLLIIEAMKVMNPIKASRGGTVTQVLVENGQPVEFGEVMVVIE
jgi:acetyl-CoA carboxylase biotin carboxyl carrier protein